MASLLGKRSYEPLLIPSLEWVDEQVQKIDEKAEVDVKLELY